MVGQLVLVQSIGVRIPVPEQIKTPLFAKGGVFILFMPTILMLPRLSLPQNPIQAFF